MRLIRADEVVREDVFDRVHAFLNDLRVIGAAILPQQELKDINRHICPFFDLLGQILADNLPVELLPQFGLDDGPCVIGLCKAVQSNRPLSSILFQNP